jgi:uncharacterized membrane protein YphA (DoxX/SURF4 family)
LILVTSGILLLIGLFTPAAGALAGLATLGVALSWFPPPARNLFDSTLAAVLVADMCAALALLGPGAISVDCRLFGRREIIIPEVSRPPAE